MNELSTRKLSQCTTLAQAFQAIDLRDLIAQTIPDHLKADAMLRTWIQAATKQPDIYKADFRQALGMFQSLAYLGLAPNTPLGHAYIIPFNTKKGVELQLVIGYPGYIELAERSNTIRSIHCDTVHDERIERFSYSFGSRQHLEHGGKPYDFRPEGDPRYAYAWVRRTNDDEQFEVLTWHEVEKIRERSQAYRSAKETLDKSIAERWSSVPQRWTDAAWNRDQTEMAKKTALRRLMKWLPKAPELRAAVGMEEANRDFGPIIDGTATPLDGIPEKMPEPPTERENTTTTVDYGRKQEPPKQPPPKKTQPKPEPRPEPEFQHWLVNHDGEIERNAPYLDPVTYARAYVALRAKTATEDRAELAGKNDEGLTAVEKDAEARAILEAAVTASEPPSNGAAKTDVEDVQDDPCTEVVTPALDRANRVNWLSYPALIGAVVARLGQADDANRWLELQYRTLFDAPVPTRMKAITAINNRLRALGLTMPPRLTALMSAKTAIDALSDEDRAEVVLRDLSYTTDREQIKALDAKHESWLKALKQRDPKLFETIVNGPDGFAEALRQLNSELPLDQGGDR